MPDDDSPYPDVPEDADGFDAVVRLLSEMDGDHFQKAVGLVGTAQREFQLAVENGQLREPHADVTFEEFADVAADQWTAKRDDLASAED